VRALKRVVLGTPACLAHDLNAAGSVVRTEPGYERMEGSGGLLLATRRPSVARNRLPLCPQQQTFRGPRWTAGYPLPSTINRGPEGDFSLVVREAGIEPGECRRTISRPMW